MAYIYYTDIAGGYIIRLDTVTSEQVVLTTQSPLLPSPKGVSIAGCSFGSTMALANGNVVVWFEPSTDSRYQQVLEVPPDLQPNPDTAPVWQVPFGIIGSNGFVSHDFGSGVYDPRNGGTYWTDFAYDGEGVDTGACMALTGFDEFGAIINTVLECRSMYDNGGDGNLFVGAQHRGCCHLSLGNGWLYRSRESWDAISRWDPDSGAWQGIYIPYSQDSQGNYLSRQDFAGGYDFGILTYVNSNDKYFNTQVDKQGWVRIYDPDSLIWWDVGLTKGMGDPTQALTTLWGDPIAEWNPFASGGPDPLATAGISINAGQQGQTLVDGTTLLFASMAASPNPDVAFSLWEMDLLTGVVSHYMDVPEINFRADGTLTTFDDPQKLDTNAVLPMGLLRVEPQIVTPWIIGQAGPTRNVFYDSSQ